LNFLMLLGTVAPVFVLMLVGYVVFRVGWLSDNADASLLRITVNLLFPCLILHTVMSNSAVMTPANLTWPPFLGFATVALGFLVSYLAAPLLGVREPVQRRTFAFTTGLANYGYIALPVTERLFGPGSKAIVLIHNVGVETALWTVGIMLLAGTSPRQAWRHILSPPVLAIVAALALHFSGARGWLPHFLLSAIEMIGVTAVPFGLILTGATFADQMRKVAAPGSAAVGIGSVLLRLALLPMGILALAKWLPISPELRQVLMVQAAMPAAVIPVILAKHYGGNPATALRIVLITSVLGLLTIPLWLQAGKHFLGLRFLGE
jgi:malate permease and related proteins